MEESNLSKNFKLANGILIVFIILSVIEVSKKHSSFMYIPFFPLIGVMIGKPLSYMIVCRNFGIAQLKEEIKLSIIINLGCFKEQC